MATTGTGIGGVLRSAALGATLAAMSAGPAGAAKLCTRNQGENGMTCRTSRVEAVFLDGAVVGVKNLLTGEVHASRALADVSLYRGLGHFTGNPHDAACLQSVWGTNSSNP